MNKHLRTRLICRLTIALVYILILSNAWAECIPKSGAEDASNPLAKVKNADLRWQRLDAKVMQL